MHIFHLYNLIDDMILMDSVLAEREVQKLEIITIIPNVGSAWSRYSRKIVKTHRIGSTHTDEN